VEDETKKELGSAPTTPAPPDSHRGAELAAGSGPDSTLDMPAADVVAQAGEPGPGAALGHFRVRKKLGAGGMGVVLECEDADLGRRVAVKLVRAEADTPQYRERLLREAKAMARLEHANVVRVYEVGSDRGRLFIAMELVDGVTLTAWLQERRSWPEIVAMFRQVGAGLAAVHRAGLVHRDFKPDNVLVDAMGRARVADFGLARIDDNETPAMTKTGVMMGTPGYMAPEQQFGSGVDARADQYSFCVALREALGGRPLDDARWKAVPEAVRAIVTRGLSYDPDERFPALEALLDALSASAPAEPAPKEPRWPIALATLAVLGGVSGVVAYVTSRRHDPATDKAPPLAVLPPADAAVARPVENAVAPRDAPLAVAAPIDAAVEVARTVTHDARVHVATGPGTAPPPVAKGSAAISAGSPPPNTPGGPLIAGGPSTKHLAAAKPGDPAHLPAVRAALKDLGYTGFDVDHAPSDLDEKDPIEAIQLGLVERRHGNCTGATAHWEAALDTLKKLGSDDEEAWKARAWLGRGLCSLAAGRAQDAWDQVSHAWVHGDRPQIQLVMAFAKYDLAVAANDYDGKNVAYGLLLTAEHLPDKTVHAALAIWLDGLGLGLHQDAPIH
jgi:predicted Ser/Thr protein kinase